MVKEKNIIMVNQNLKENKLKFEGEYLNGKKWIGKGFNNKGEIDFEIKEGNGKGREYNYDGKLKFEGEYLDGKRWKGKGIELNVNGNL